MAHFIRDEVGPVERIDLLGYNSLCVADYERLGVDYQLKEVPRVTEEAMVRLQEIMIGSGARRVTISHYDSCYGHSCRNHSIHSFDRLPMVGERKFFHAGGSRSVRFFVDSKLADVTEMPRAADGYLFYVHTGKEGIT